jgi:hypothetical protein
VLDPAATDGSVRLLLPSSAAREVSVVIANRAGDSAIAIDRLALEYVTNVAWFRTVTDASWTDVPHTVIPPGKQLITYLYLPARDRREIVVDLFDFPDRYLDVFVDDRRVGAIEGGVRTDERRGGPTLFSFPVPADSGSLMKITLHSLEQTEGGVAVRFAYVQQVNATGNR